MDELKIGDVTLACAVLEDETRVICIDHAEHAAALDPQNVSLDLPSLIECNSLQPFLTPRDLAMVTTRIRFRDEARRQTRQAIDAAALPIVCNALTQARTQGALPAELEPAGQAAETLNKALSTVGIIALIDEATGYQEYRRRDALQKVLEAYISPDLLPWAKRFPDVFYDELFRLRGWTPDPQRWRRPGVIGHWTNKLIYEALPTGVLDELRRKNPVDPRTGRRRNKHHQYLTQDVGHPHLAMHIHAVVALMRAYDSWEAFLRRFQKSFGRQLQWDFGMDDEDL